MPFAAMFVRVGQSAAFTQRSLAAREAQATQGIGIICCAMHLVAFAVRPIFEILHLERDSDRGFVIHPVVGFELRSALEQCLVAFDFFDLVIVMTSLSLQHLFEHDGLLRHRIFHHDLRSGCMAARAKAASRIGCGPELALNRPCILRGHLDAHRMRVVNLLNGAQFVHCMGQGGVHILGAHETC